MAALGTLRERERLDPMVELMAIGDALPPGRVPPVRHARPAVVAQLADQPARPRPTTRDGWWLLHAAADHAQGGYSSQRMTIWNADGACIAEAMQAVAIFG